MTEACTVGREGPQGPGQVPLQSRASPVGGTWGVLPLAGSWEPAGEVKISPGLCSSVLREEGSVSVAVLSHMWAPTHASQVGKVLSLSCRDLERGWVCRAACGEEPGSLDFSLAFILASDLLF